MINHKNEDNNNTKSSPLSLLSSRYIILYLIIFRIFNALLIQTYFNPDEYWQSLEVAHYIAFEKGNLTWEWNDNTRIRGILHPLIFASLYKLLEFFHLDSRFIIAQSAHVLQGIFAGIGDYYIYKLSLKYYGEEVAKWAIVVTLTCWFSLYCMVRTFSNSLETIITIMALYYWPFGYNRLNKDDIYNLKIALILAAFGCAVRPTNGVIWLILGILLLFRIRIVKELFRIIGYVFIIGFFWIIITVIIDRGSSLYGVYPWHWYLSEAIPAMLGSFIFYFIYGVINVIRERTRNRATNELICLILGVIIFYSLNEHKEYRFILPIFPVIMIYTAVSISKSIFHQRGAIKVMNYLSDITTNNNNDNTKINPLHVEFLCGCHSTPFYSQIHTNILPIMTFLDCSPMKINTKVKSNHYNDNNNDNNNDVNNENNNENNDDNIDSILSLDVTESLLYENDPLWFVFNAYNYGDNNQHNNENNENNNNFKYLNNNINQHNYNNMNECIDNHYIWLECYNNNSIIIHNICTKNGYNPYRFCLSSTTTTDDDSIESLKAIIYWKSRDTEDKQEFNNNNMNNVIISSRIYIKQQNIWKMINNNQQNIHIITNNNNIFINKRIFPDIFVLYSSRISELYPFLLYYSDQCREMKRIWHSHFGDTEYIVIYDCTGRHN